MHAYLEKFALTGRCVILEGWASNYNITLYYQGNKIQTLCTPVPRDDLAKHFGPQASAWGFSCCGLLSIDPQEVDREAFTIDYGNGITEKNPQDKYSATSDSIFREMIQEFAESVDRTSGSLLELGSRARSGAVYRDWFPGATHYAGFDVSDGPNVDIVGDAHHLSRYVQEKFDHIFSIAVFEHLFMPWKVAIEMNRVMKTGGTALTISHFAWPLHEEPWDFWRYSKEAWGALFNAHTGFELITSAYQYPTMISPYYISDENTKVMSQGPAYLLSGCLVRKTGPAKVWWDAEVGDILDVNYSHK